MQTKNNPVVNDAMPHDVRAERGIIGSMAIDPDAYLDVAEIISAESFFLAIHKTLFAAYAALAERDTAVDSITWGEELARRGQLKDVGGMAYLSTCVNNTPTALHAVEYAKIVALKYKLRKLTTAAGKVVAKVSEHADHDAVALAAECENLILDVLGSEKQDGATPLVDRLTPFYEALEERRKHPGQLLGISTGLVDLDTKLSGLQGGDLIYLAGRPGMGKSAVLLRFTASACQAGEKVLYFSTEMTTDQLLQRLVGMLSGVEMTKIRDGTLTDEEMVKVATALESISDFDCVVYSDMDIDKIASVCRREERKGGVGFVAIDHIGHVTCEAKDFRSNRVQEISYYSMRFKALAMTTHLPFVVASQLNRKLESRSDKHPMLADLRESGAIEQDADVILFLFRAEYYEEDTTEPLVMEIDIAKQRNGPTGRVYVWFEKDTSVFKNLAKTKIEDLGF